LSRRRTTVLSCLLASGLCALGGAPALAQPTPAPTAYTVTEFMQIGPKVTTTVYRDGPVAVMDNPDSHSRSYYDLANGRTYGWSTTGAEPQCSSGTFSGDWGDPFNAGGLAKEIAALNPRDGGVEIVNGIHTKVLEATDPQGGAKIRLSVDATYGEVVRWIGAGPDGKTRTMLEVKSLTLGKPARAVFSLPASCAKLASQPLPPTEAQRIATLTGSAPGTYVSANSGGPSQERCTVQFSVVQPKTLTPIPSAYRVAVDPAHDFDKPASYTIGGTPLFSGGGLHEVTDQLRSGVLTLADLSSGFDVEIVFGGDAGFGSATLYRRCAGKSTARLLFVLNNAAKPSDGGEWVWGP
jgi:hypothetical protein